MATVLTISASPSATSKSAATRRLVDEQLSALGHTVHALDARDLPPAALLGADTSHPAIAEALRLFERAQGVVVVTPVYKASYSGLLKTLLDLLPQSGLATRSCCRWPPGARRRTCWRSTTRCVPCSAPWARRTWCRATSCSTGHHPRAGRSTVFAEETRAALSRAVQRFATRSCCITGMTSRLRRSTPR
jgi:hypothetical protein